MSFKLLNQLAKIYERIKGDTEAKIGFVIFNGGLLLTAGASYSITTSYKNSDGKEFAFSASVNGGDWFLLILGLLFLIAGFALLIHRYRTLNKKSELKNIALFFMPGFGNLNENSCKYALPPIEQNNVREVKFKCLPSYEADKVAKEYQYLVRDIIDRLEHNGVEKAYLAALGSVPYLYLIGTLFRNGHIPLRVLEHDRSNDKWHLLQDLGQDESLQYSFKNNYGDDALSIVKANSKNEIGFSISFTNAVLEKELPLELQGHTLDAKLQTGYRFDAIPTDPVQDDIVKELAHTITFLAKKADKIHLFICTQGSIAIKLGKLYQDNMSGFVVIHNYDPEQKTYNWAIEFDRKLPLVYCR